MRMKKEICLGCVLFMLNSCSNPQAESNIERKNELITHRYCGPNGRISGIICYYEFDELIALNAASSKENRIGVEVIGVLRRRNLKYYLYKNLSNQTTSSAIRVSAINDNIFNDPKVHSKLVDSNVVVVGYYDPKDGLYGSLDIYSVLWYSGKWNPPPAKLKVEY